MSVPRDFVPPLRGRRPFGSCKEQLAARSRRGLGAVLLCVVRRVFLEGLGVARDWTARVKPPSVCFAFSARLLCPQLPAPAAPSSATATCASTAPWCATVCRTAPTPGTRATAGVSPPRAEACPSPRETCRAPLPLRRGRAPAEMGRVTRPRKWTLDLWVWQEQRNSYSQALVFILSSKALHNILALILLVVYIVEIPYSRVIWKVS